MSSISEIKRIIALGTRKEMFLAFMEFEYLGHVISADNVRLQKSKIEAVKQWPEPQSMNEL